MIFRTNVSLSPIHTIDQITEVLQLHRNVDKKTARHMAIAALAQVEIPKPEKAVDRYAFEYSGGSARP